MEECVHYFATFQRIQTTIFADLADSISSLLCPGRAVTYFPSNNATYRIPSPCKAIVLSETSPSSDVIISGIKANTVPDVRHFWLLVLLPEGVEASLPSAPVAAQASTDTKAVESGLPGMTVLKRKDDDNMRPISKSTTAPPPPWKDTSSTCKFSGEQRNYLITKCTAADVAFVSGKKFKPPNTVSIATALGPLLAELDSTQLELDAVDLQKECRTKSLNFETASKQADLAAFARAYALCKFLTCF